MILNLITNMEALIAIIGGLIVGLGMYTFFDYVFNKSYRKSKCIEESVNDVINQYEDKVSCEKCACLLFKNKANKVTTYTDIYNALYDFTLDKYYCNNCKPNYDSITSKYSDKIKYHKKLEVTADGEPVGYIKKK